MPSFSHFFDTLFSSSDVFIRAMLLTLELTVVSILVGIFIGLLFALLKISNIKILAWISDTYVFLVRGTPLIVQIFILYFGISNLFLLPDFWAASLALAFHNGAYISEILRGTIQSIDKGQMEAGRSLGMSNSLTLRRIILPQAFRRALPPLGNQFIIGLKDSSLAAFISMNELFNVATTLGSNNFDEMTYLLIVAVYYLILVAFLTIIVNLFEKKLSISDR
ncbi:amino acid ABC transporter permease [Peribacillus frigoritolerans]|uniref:amino acid ABC transporter permease n=1 Tax=Peribacillus TaxID=2675229 RepID=UPI00055540A7|nr:MULTISPECIES: amino acid ABC transporter permease [Peribacillus]KRF50954.1 cystine transporter permease [Bacillus sp. Soil745]MBD8137957.1 amino acid ABC transporter permease [Bacillus sp. CFBP 13597]MBT2603505.1 amino acid ABC transporter permease [Bacillus sp. ISL-53]PCD07432.1 amino acid ABC transporter permease [Peribacillus simplex]PEF37470.1 amino acid ABC transporter permease [Bacillus sp. AFS094228]PEO49927.1 amino acid ABC transporter permease [Bacillus sp. AFS026049]PHD77531.1 a